MNHELLKASLESGVWGTIGPHSERAAERLCEKCGGAFAVLMHSATGAYETALRAAGVGHGDKVLCAASCDPMDGQTPVLLGAEPVFADGKAGAGLTPEAVRRAAERVGKLAAVTVDLTPELDLAGLKSACRALDCRLILNAGSAVGQRLDFDGLFAAVYDLGVCGAVVVGTQEDYQAIFAWHHCGHAPGTAASLTFEEIVGGDMRVSEWQAIQAYEIIAAR